VFGRCPIRISVTTLAIFTEVFRGSLKILQEDAREHRDLVMRASFQILSLDVSVANKIFIGVTIQCFEQRGWLAESL
jgi:hypothetical protein